MNLVADAGSSKIDWAFIEGKEVLRFQTPGTNPSILANAQIIIETWGNTINNFPKKLENIHFFGAGCRDEIANNKIKEALQNTFIINGVLEIDSDIIGAARGLYGKEQGNILILGTGLNTGYYDGSKIAFKSPSLGYLLGDEGSGFDLGKTIIAAYLRKQLDTTLSNTLLQYFITKNIQDPISFIYGQAAPNKIIASILEALKDHLQNATLKQIVRERFECMIQNNCLPYQTYSTEFRAIGSIAYHFQHELADTLAKHNYHLSQVQQSPIEGLIEFYSN